MKTISTNPLISKFPTFIHLVDHMIKSLERSKEWDGFIVDMDTFGNIDSDGLCFGCAATASMAAMLDDDYKKAAGIDLGVSYIQTADDTMRPGDIYSFEQLINLVRMTIYTGKSLTDAPDEHFAPLGGLLLEEYVDLPELESESWQQDLPVWKEFIKKWMPEAEKISVAHDI